MNILKQTYAVVAIVAMMLCPQSVWADCAPNAHAYTYGKQSDGTYFIKCSNSGCSSVVDPNYALLYTSVGNEIVEPDIQNIENNRIIYNDNINGCGVIVFENVLTKVYSNFLRSNPKKKIYKNLTSIVLPNSVKIIDEYAFYESDSLKVIELGNSLEIIGSRAFAGCDTLQYVDLPNTLRVVDSRAFMTCKSAIIKFRSIPLFGIDALRNINRRQISFDLCDDSFVSIDEDEEYDEGDFPSVSSATYTHNTPYLWGSAIVPFSVTSSDDVKVYTIETLFESNTTNGFMMKEVSGENSIAPNTPFFYKKVDPASSSVVFSLASGTVVAPYNTSFFKSSVNGASEFSLVGTYADTIISSNGEKTYFMQQSASMLSNNESTVSPFSVWMEKEGFANANEYTFNDEYGIIYYQSTDDKAITLTAGSAFLDVNSNPVSVVRNEKSSDGIWSLLFNAPVSIIGNNAFNGCTTLKVIELPNSITTIGNNVFQACNNLESITMSDNLESIGEYSFQGTKLSSISIPSTVNSIGIACFSECASLTDVNFLVGSKLKIINQDLFLNCSNLQTINVPNGVTTFENGAFKGCELLASITLPSSLSNLDDNVFYGCSSLVSIILPQGVKSIGMSAFENCSKLKSCTFQGSKINVIKSSAFKGCSSLTYFTIPELITEIQPSLFEGCTSLREVTFHDDITSIGELAFSGSGILSADFPTDLQNVGASSFADCKNLTYVQFYSYPSLGANVFANSNSAEINVDLDDDSYLCLNTENWSDITATTKASYSRSMVSDWGTAILPFDVTIDKGNVLYYVLNNVSEDAMSFTTIEDDVIPANTPFVFKKKNNDASIVINGSKLANISNTEYEVSTSAANWKMCGTYDTTNKENVYFISQNQFWYAQVAAEFGKFRAWIKPEIPMSTPGGFASASFRILVDQNENETSILEIAEDGSVQDATQGIYDLSGHKLSAPVKGQMNIIDGKKVFIK